MRLARYPPAWLYAVVTAVVPYLAYARKDRRTQIRDPITTRYVAELLEAVGKAALIEVKSIEGDASAA